MFSTAVDPVKAGLVASFNRPGGNVTGINYMNLDIGAKRLGLLNDLIPGASCLAVLVDPTSIFTQPIVDDLHEAASKIGRQIEPFAAGSPREIDLSFAKIAEKHCKGLLVAPMPLFFDLRLKNLRWPLDTPFLPSIPRASGGGRWNPQLRIKLFGSIPASRDLCGPHTQWENTSGAASFAGNEIRIGHQSSNRPGARRGDTAQSTHYRR